jgi:MFS family permease
MVNKSSTAPSDWGLMGQPAFRGMAVAGTLFFIGNGMQMMAASWLMVERGGSSLLAALVQTAVFLPMFLLALPGGVLADTADRRRLISWALIGLALACLALSLAELLGQPGPGLVLFLVFLSGCCIALLTPAWNSAVIDPLPRKDWAQAITVINIAYNIARALGPTLAGALFAWLGPGWVFAVSVLTTVVMWESNRRWPPKAHPPSRLPAERLWAGMLSGIRFAWHSRMVLSQLVRAMAFNAAGSALWALLPVIAQRQLGTGAQGFGLLMGCLGAGAVAMGLVVGRMRQRFGLDAVVVASCIVFAFVMALAALVRVHWVIYGAMCLGGAAWMATTSTYNSATQGSVPPWVRSRAVAMHIVVSLGAFAIGSAVWGAVSDLLSLQVALWCASVLMLSGLVLVRPMPLRVGELSEVTPAGAATEVGPRHEPDLDAGPVAVELSYRIGPGRDEAFLEVTVRARATRRRDGATFWRVYRDLGEPSRYVERFIVKSWADYLRQRARSTLADQQLEAELQQFLAPGERVQVSHYIAER